MTNQAKAHRNHEEALDRFIGNVCRIREIADAIRKAADDHFNTAPEDIHWGHVGTTSHYIELLEEVLADVERITK